MSKQQIIDAIRERNRSAEQEFLVRFDESALRNYLDRLTRVSGCRGRSSVWVRRSDSPAVVAYHTAA